MVPRFRSRSLSLRPINRIKHVVDAQGGTALGVTEIRNLIETVDSPTLLNTSEIAKGSTVNGIYLKVEVVNDGVDGILPNVYLVVAKNPGGNLGALQPNLIGADDDKRFVIHQEMLMLQPVNNSNPRTLFNGVIVIPRGYRRFSANDTLILELLSPGVAINWCFQCHYKEFH